MKDRLKVSIGSDIVNDCMHIVVHLCDKPIIEGVIKDRKEVTFPNFSTQDSFSLDEVREIFEEFLEKMETTENVSI